METPPQFTPSGGPPKKSNTVLIVVLTILGLCAVCCVGGVFVIYGLAKKGLASVGCITHYELAREALSDYAVAHDGKLPPASSWQDAIVPYYGKHKSDHPANGGGIIDLGDATRDLGCAAEEGAGPTGMAFNLQLSGMSVDKAKENPSTVLLFEVPQVGRNLSMKYAKPPGQSPLKIFGQARDWITAPVQGSMNINPKTTNDDNRGVNGL